jgi:acylphosphatase
VAESGFRVTGRVQGVGFRWWTRALGTRLGLSGSVRNLPDGSVVVHARGTDDQLRDLEAQLAGGPPIARVHAVERVPFDPDGVRDGDFAVLR